MLNGSKLRGIVIFFLIYRSLLARKRFLFQVSSYSNLLARSRRKINCESNWM